MSPSDTVEWILLRPTRLGEDALELDLTNNSGEAISISWATATYAGLDGSVRDLRVGGLALEDTLQSFGQTVPADSTVRMVLSPSPPVRFPETVRDSAAAQALCEELQQKNITISVPMRRGPATRTYSLTFTADIHLRLAAATSIRTFTCVRSHLLPGLGPVG